MAANACVPSDSGDLVAFWRVTLCDAIHRVELEHGMTTGKRIIRVDGKEVLRRNWMFRLTGSEHFTLQGGGGAVECRVLIGYNSEVDITGVHIYSLYVDGLQVHEFNDKQRKVLASWSCGVASRQIRITVDKQTLDVWVDGQRALTTAEFVEDGTETHFVVGEAALPAYIRMERTGKEAKKLGKTTKLNIIYRLFMNNSEIPPCP